MSCSKDDEPRTHHDLDHQYIIAVDGQEHDQRFVIASWVSSLNKEQRDDMPEDVSEEVCLPINETAASVVSNDCARSMGSIASGDDKTNKSCVKSECLLGGNNFWQLTWPSISEKYFIPEYIKKMLTLSGYDNAVTLASMTEEDIKEAEQFVSPILLNHISAEEKKEYFPNILNQGDNVPFRMLPGHRKLVTYIIATCHKYLKKNRKSKTIKLEKLQTPVKSYPVDNEDEFDDQNCVSMATADNNKYCKHLQSILLKWYADNEDNLLPNQRKRNVGDYFHVNVMVIEQHDEVTIQGDILCQLCRKSFRCCFRKGWTLSNIYRHIRHTHFDPRYRLSTKEKPTRETFEREKPMRKYRKF